jgi:hypothetical protein
MPSLGVNLFAFNLLCSLHYVTIHFLVAMDTGSLSIYNSVSFIKPKDNGPNTNATANNLQFTQST